MTDRRVEGKVPRYMAAVIVASSSQLRRLHPPRRKNRTSAGARFARASVQYRRGNNMRSAEKILVSLALTTTLAAPAFAATITGSVNGPDGKPFMGAFVVAENMQNKMTVSVLSDEQGRYHIANMPAPPS